MEDWPTSNLLPDDWCLPEIKEAREESDKINFENERPLSSKLLSNLSAAELEQMRKETLRIIAACGLYPEGEIESAEDRERQVGCKNEKILTDHRVTTDIADVGQSSGEGSTEETHANPGPDDE